jgi:hypothetical protein
MRVTRRGVLQGLTASVGLLNVPAIVIRASADAEPPPLRPGEILPDPDFSLLSPTTPFVVGIRPHREGGVCLKLEDEPIPSRIGPKFLIHNNGHGGAGITLSFGCASVVADHIQMLMRDMRRSRMRPSVAVGKAKAAEGVGLTCRVVILVPAFEPAAMGRCVATVVVPLAFPLGGARRARILFGQHYRPTEQPR